MELHRLALAFFNFSCVFCYKWENQTFKISNFLAFFNFLKIPLVHILAFVFGILWKAETVKSSIVDLERFSQFTIAMIYVLSSLLTNTTIILSLLQVCRRKSVQKLINLAVATPLEKKFLESFKRNCLEQSLPLFAAFIIVSVLNMFSFLKMNILSFALYFLFLFPNLVVIGFVLFTKVFEGYFAELLSQLLANIKRADKQKHLEQQLSMQYERIYNLSSNFNLNFGAQLTIAICGISSLLVSQVRERTLCL